MAATTSLPMTTIINTENDDAESARSANDFCSSSTVFIIPESQEITNSTEQIITSEASGTNRSRIVVFLRCLKRFHFKENRQKSDRVLIVFRSLSVIGLFIFGIIDTMMFSTKSKDRTDTLRFIYGLHYIPIELFTIIYASGAAAFGIDVGIYVLVFQAIINSILLARNCEGSDEVINEILWVVKLGMLFAAVELCYRNFRKLGRHQMNFNSATRSMLRQALIVGATMLIENVTGIRALYRAINTQVPHHCTYEISHCGIMNLYEPSFKLEDDECLNDLSSYVAGREQIRILRNFILLNIVSYSVFNRNFLKIKANAKHLVVRLLLIILFLTLATSIPVSYVDAPFFIEKCRLVYNIIEIIIFLIASILMMLNLYQLRRQPEDHSSAIEEMDRGPSLIP